MAKSNTRVESPLPIDSRCLMQQVLAVHAAHALQVVDCSKPCTDPVPDETRLRLQREAIVHIINKISAGRASTCTVVEFGAGEGALSHALWRAGTASKYVVVDRSRNKLARMARSAAAEGFPSEQLCIDVADLLPEALRNVVPTELSIVLANHMCGSALDTAISCAASAWHDDVTATLQPQQLLEGIVAVTCCHHGCTWASYLGRDFFHEVGLSALEFASILQWSRLAPRRNKKASTRERVMDTAAELGITSDQAAELGTRCRQLLDTGRAHYLQQRGFHVVLVHHVDFSLTADNVMLLASRQPIELLEAQAFSQQTSTCACEGAPQSVQD